MKQRSTMEKDLLAQIEEARVTVYETYPDTTEIIPSFWEGRELYLDVNIDGHTWRRFFWRVD